MIAESTWPGENGIGTLPPVMADDDENKPHHATARPPPGEEDVYSASTVVGEASDEILAIIRGEKAPAAPSVPNIEGGPSAKVEVKEDAKADAKTDAKPPPPKPPIPAPRPSAGMPPPPDAKPAYTATPLEVPLTKLEPTSVPPAGVEIAPDPEPVKAEAPPTPSAPERVVSSAPSAAPAPLAEANAEAQPNFKKGTLHPALGIVLFFIAVVAVLAALIR